MLLDSGDPEEPPRPSRKEHLVGLLSRIGIASLFSLFDLERVSGEMRLALGDRRIRVYVRDGRVIDAVRAGSNGTAREALRGVIEAKDGTFDFTPMDIDRPDRIGLSTTGLLLELAREHDEGSDDSLDVVFDQT